MAQQMLAALNALYHQDGTKIKDEASKFLEQWQQSVEAWSVSDSVLHDPASNMEAQYFCAQTLRTKVQRDFEELPGTAVDSLRDSLMTLLLKYAKGPPPVRTQLCLALVAMTVHVPADRWSPPPGIPVPESLAGGGAVTWFATSLQRAPADAALPCLLELLTVLPQEVNSMKYAVRPERRRQHAQELRAATGAAINILTGCLSSPGSVGAGSERLRPALLEAFGGWLRLSEGAALGPDGSQLSSHPLVVACLEGLRSSSDLFHAACDAVCELVWCTVDHTNGAVDPGMMPLIQALVPAVMALQPRFAVASRRAAEELAEEEGEPSHRGGPAAQATDEFDDDEHTAKGMARLFAEVGEAYVHLIATAVQEVQAPVEALLEVAGYPEPSIASMSFNFWHRLARSFTSGWGPKNMAGSRTNSFMDVTLEATPEGQAALAEQARRRAFFTPAFERLVLVVRGKVKFPASSSRWSKEQFADFRRHRYEIADSLEDCASVLGFQRCLELLIEPLAQLSMDMQAGGKPFDWRAAEAAMFCIRSIGPHSQEQGPGQPTQLSQLLVALPTLPRQFPLLMSCCCYTVARYAGWLAASLAVDGGPAGRELLTKLLDLAVSCLDVPEASSGACSAILDLCAYCGRYMAPNIPTLTTLYTRLQGSGACSSGASAALISASRGAAVVAEEDVQLVIQAVCIAVCKSLPVDQLQAAATALLQPVLSAVQVAAQQLPSIPTQLPPGSPSLSSQHPTISPLMDRLATLFSHFANPKAVAEMLVQSWSALNMVLTRAMWDARLMERACRALRLGIKGAGPDGLPMMPSLLNELAARFRATRHSAFLYILSELIKIHGTNDSCAPSLAPVLTSLVVDACSGLRTLPQLQQDPELVDDVYLLAVRVLTYSPRLLLQPLVGTPVGGASPASTMAALTALLDTSLLGVLMQHREACCSVLSFLVKLLQVAQAGEMAGISDALAGLLTPRAAMLTRLLMAGVAGVLPTARLGDVAALLCALLRAFQQQALSWLVAAVACLPDTVVSQADKDAYLGAANTVLAQESTPQVDRAWEGSVDDFADLCRRNPRVRTSAQQALVPPELASAIVM